jgi:adenine phosphoribosyltransferase
MDYRPLIREHPLKNRCDLSRLLRDATAFRALIDDLAAPFRDDRVDLVAALDAMGFVLGGAVAVELGAGVVLLRKPGLAAWAVVSEPFADYTGRQKSFEMVADAVTPGDRVLVVDDWSETGAQLEAAVALLERAGALVVGAAVLRADADRAEAGLRRYRLHSVMGDR